ncbi:MAG: YaaC family protein [Candidatus Aminicenantales bacterium]
MTICRYDKQTIVTTKVDPIEDICGWVSGLRSSGYASDLLKEIHGFADLQEIKDSTKAITSHAEHAVHLLHQGMAGPVDVSYLPLYYCMLNLAKICIIATGYRKNLSKQRWHGATYPIEKDSQDLINETIYLKERGAIPLFYKSITGEALPNTSVKLALRQVYPYIRYVSHEYCSLYKAERGYVDIELEYKGNKNLGYKIQATIDLQGRQSGIKANELRVLRGFRQIAGNQLVFETDVLKGNLEDVQARLLTKVRRFLLVSDIDPLRNIRCDTPVSSSRLFAPEELHILLAFFHLSNVVRYKPEFLDKLKDSRSWALLVSLPRHGTLTFLEHFWSFMHKRVTIVTSP